jgi:hypothetical protein
MIFNGGGAPDLFFKSSGLLHHASYHRMQRLRAAAMTARQTAHNSSILSITSHNIDNNAEIFKMQCLLHLFFFFFLSFSVWKMEGLPCSTPFLEVVGHYHSTISNLSPSRIGMDRQMDEWPDHDKQSWCLELSFNPPPKKQKKKKEKKKTSRWSALFFLPPSIDMPRCIHPHPLQGDDSSLTQFKA